MAAMMQQILWAGSQALVDYVATHVLTCLVPAFLLAGAMVTFIRREAVLRHLGAAASTRRSFSLASAASFLIAACSCTVIPVASGLYFAGATIGAAFIVLWVAPAANILALVYTGQILGAKMVISRIVAALMVAFAVGLIMNAGFRKEQTSRVDPSADRSPREPVIGRSALVLIALLVLTLLLPNYLVTTSPYLYKVALWFGLTLLTAAYAWFVLTGSQIRRWLHETWWFVRLIFPLLLAGVFLVGVIGYLLPPAWIERWLSGNGLLACLFASLLGAVSYFATMTEAPFVDTLMNLGMGKGPALALLLTGPGISLPNWLAIARVFGIKKALVYVPTIMVLGTLVGWLFGNFVL
jgi:hypothetical protein